MRLRAEALSGNIDLLIQSTDEWLTWALQSNQRQQLSVLSTNMRKLLSGIDSGLPGLLNR